MPLENMGSLAPLVVSLAFPDLLFWMTPVNNYFPENMNIRQMNLQHWPWGRPNILVLLLTTLPRKQKFPLPHPKFSFFHHSHPSLFERENALRNVTFSSQV